MAITKIDNGSYPDYVKTSSTFAVGTTLEVGYEIMQVMSDIWEQALCATYWNEEKQCVERAIWIHNGEVDATPEVIAKAKAYIYTKTYDRAFRNAKAEAEMEARYIVKGSKVKVVSGRTAKGLEGPVVVVIQRAYGMGYRASMENKVAIAKSEVKVKVPASNGKVYENYRDLEWVWARNCELVEVPAIDLESVKERAENEAAYEVRCRKWAAPAR
jgi:hypothetical protein